MTSAVRPNKVRVGVVGAVFIEVVECDTSFNRVVTSMAEGKVSFLDKRFLAEMAPHDTGPKPEEFSELLEFRVVHRSLHNRYDHKIYKLIPFQFYRRCQKITYDYVFPQHELLTTKLPFGDRE
jgi:hypothetical protein